DHAAYRTRERVERLINRLKQFRRLATRYEKRGHHYLALVTLAAIILWLPFENRQPVFQHHRWAARTSANDRQATPTDVHQLFCAFRRAARVVLHHTRTVHAQAFRCCEMIDAVVV